MNGEQSELEHLLGHHFRNPALVVEALTHSIDGQETPKTYQRLEFLGDRVLGLVVAELLLARFPDEAEGAIAKRHSALVKGEALARVGRQLNMGPHMLLSQQEIEAGGRENPNILADIMESLIAALYLDGGLEAARVFIHQHWTAMMEETPIPPGDSKTELQEWAQGAGRGLPEYVEIGREGPDHAPIFTFQVQIEGVSPATGAGSNKRNAEKAAAKALLEQLGAGEMTVKSPESAS